MTARLLLKAAAFLAGAVLLLELGARAVDRLRGRPFDSAGCRDRIEAIRRSLSTPVAAPSPPESLLQPYFAWEDADTEARLADDAEYYARPEAEAAFDILVLGGSEAAVLGRAGSAALAASFHRLPSLRDREVRVHAFALEGFKQPQALMTLVVLLSMGHAPDLVIELDGRDEALLGWSNAQAGTHPLHPSVAYWSRASGGARSDWELAERFHDAHEKREHARSVAGRILATGVWRSALLEPLAEWRLEGRRQDVLTAEGRAAEYLATRPREAELDGPSFARDEAGIVATITGGWEEASISMQALCASRGIGYLHILEPAPEAAPEPVERIYADLRARGVSFLDASELFRAEGLRDAHGNPTARGCEILAEAAAGAWLAAGSR